MDITLTPRSEAIIRRQVESGRYGAASDVVREALDLLEARDAKERLRAEVGRGLEQLERGEGIDYTPAVMERLKREAAENARRGKPVKDAVVP